MVNKRFFVHQTKQNREWDELDKTYTPTCSVLDRETVVNGKYDIIIKGVKYLDAYAVASQLNKVHKKD